jgi:hypothetical protein
MRLNRGQREHAKFHLTADEISNHRSDAFVKTSAQLKPFARD